MFLTWISVAFGMKKTGLKDSTMLPKCNLKFLKQLAGNDSCHSRDLFCLLGFYFFFFNCVSSILLLCCYISFQSYAWIAFLFCYSYLLSCSLNGFVVFFYFNELRCMVYSFFNINIYIYILILFILMSSTIKDMHISNESFTH